MQRELGSLTEELRESIQAGDTARLNAALEETQGPWGMALGKDGLVDAMRRAMECAISCQKTACVERLLPLTDVESPLGDDTTFLMMACWWPVAKTVELLIPRSDANARMADGQTALMMAADNGNAEIVKLLLPAADPNLVNKEGLNALMMAAGSPSEGNAEGCEACVRLLADITADLEAKSASGFTALMIAATNREGVAHKPLLGVCDPETRSGHKGRRALEIAIARGRTACVMDLCSVSDLSARNTEGLTVFEQAIDRGRWELADQLPLEKMPFDSIKRAIEKNADRLPRASAWLEARELAGAIRVVGEVGPGAAAESEETAGAIRKTRKL